jgi:hypothetical protein
MLIHRALTFKVHLSDLILERNMQSFESEMKKELVIFISYGPLIAIYGVSKMLPFSWPEAELLKSVPSSHGRTEKRYSLDNEDFEFTSLIEVFWVLEDHGLLREGATYYAANFAKVEPDCFDRVDDFLEGLEVRYVEKFGVVDYPCFTAVDDAAKLDLKRVVTGWIEEHVIVPHQWCMVGDSQKLSVSKEDIPRERV